MKFNPEIEHGNIEYKFTLIHAETNLERRHELASQMRFRLYEGKGEAYYYIGVADDGTPEGIPGDEMSRSLDVLAEIGKIAGAKVTTLRKTDGNSGSIAECFVIKQKNPKEIPPDLRIALVGNVDAGKSTVIGVLENNELDDGRGAARSRVVRYLHELESGRTSSIKTTVIGFDISGSIVNHDKLLHPTDFELLERSVKTITFVDLAGHEKYLKTTIKGLTGLNPDYALLVVSANQGVLQMTKEHLGLIVALKIPFFVLLSKIDITPGVRTNRTIEELKKILKIPGVSRVPLIIKDIDDIVISAKNIANKSVVPIFKLSAVNGQGFDEVKQFLRLLPINNSKTKHDENEGFRAYIDDIFSVQGVGTVVSGMVYHGSIKTNEIACLGPSNSGEFRNVRIKSMHYKRVNVEVADSGQMITFALHGVKRDDVRKGMVLLDAGTKGASKRFSAEIYVLYHSTTIKEGYTPVIHCKSISQAARITSMDSKQIRTGDRAIVEFEFLYRPEHIRSGQRIIFREGRTKGIGIVTSILDDPK